MAITEALRLIIDADTRGAVKDIERLGTTADRELSKSKNSLDKLGHGLTTVGAGMIGFGAAALVGLGKAAQASEEAALSVIKLENTLANMPKLAGESSKQFIDLADSIQDVTAADADAIVEAEALLGTFNLTAQEIKGITPLVVDYARKFGVDIPDAAIQVGKALDGQVGALKRNGVSIDEVLFKTDRYRAVNEALSEQVGGFAEAEGATFAGSLERLKNQLGDLAEGVGTGAVDAFSSMFGVVEGLTDRFGELSPETQNAIGKIATFGATGIVAAGGMSVLIGQVILARQRFADAATAIGSFIGPGGLGGLARTLAKGGVILGAFIAFEEILDAAFGENTKIASANLGRLQADLVKFGEGGKVSGELLALAGKDFDKLKDAFKEADLSGLDKARASIDRFSSSIPLAGRALGQDFAKGIDESKQAIDDFDKALASIAQKDPEAAFNVLKSASRELGISVEDLRPKLDDYDATLGDVAAGAALAGVPVDEFGRELNEQEESAENATTALQEYNDALRAGLDPLFGAISASNSLADANNSVTEAEAKVAEAIRDHGEGSAEAAEAQRGLTEAQLSAAKAAADEEFAFNDLSDAILSQGLRTDEAKAKLDQWVAQGRITQGSADAVKGRIDALTGAIGQVPTGHNTNMTTTGTANSDVANLKARLDAMPNTKNIEINFNVRVPAGVDIGKVLTFRQHGGPVKAGEGYVVGEQRPEFFVPETDGYILPEVPKLVRGPGVSAGGGTSGGGQPEMIEVHSHLYLDGAQVAESQRRYKRNNGLDWRS